MINVLISNNCCTFTDWFTSTIKTLSMDKATFNDRRKKLLEQGYVIKKRKHYCLNIEEKKDKYLSKISGGINKVEKKVKNIKNRNYPPNLTFNTICDLMFFHQMLSFYLVSKASITAKHEHVKVKNQIDVLEKNLKSIFDDLNKSKPEVARQITHQLSYSIVKNYLHP